MDIKNIFKKESYKNLIKTGITLMKRKDYSMCSYSLEGEDIVLNLYMKKEKGFYVDVGAHHPYRFSNTHLFYKMGWQGINIDAMPGSMKLFNKLRPRDINLEIVVSHKEPEVLYYIFREKALNTLSERLAKKYIKVYGHKLVKTIVIKAMRLSDLLDRYLPKNKQIDFMNIDVEGRELDVLESNNWNLYRPKFILIEEHNFDIENYLNSPIYKFMKGKGYKLISKLYTTLIFRLK